MVIMNEQQIRQEYPFGTVSIQIGDEVRLMNEEEYEEWVAEFIINENDPDLSIGRGSLLPNEFPDPPEAN